MNLKELKDKGYQEVADMANLREEDTGIDAEIWVSAKFPGHKPRVKVKKDSHSVSISIEDQPKVLAPKNPKLDPGTIKAVMKWVAINKDLLLEYWNDPNFYTKRIYTETKKVE